MTNENVRVLLEIQQKNYELEQRLNNFRVKTEKDREKCMHSLKRKKI